MNPKDSCKTHIPCEDIKDSSRCAYSESVYGYCKWVNDKCIQSKKIGESCIEDGECQSGVCYNGKCSNCENIQDKNECKSSHGDVCDYNNGSCRYRPCSVRNNQVNSCSELKLDNCNYSHNKNNELCQYNSKTKTCSNKNYKGQIFKCKP